MASRRPAKERVQVLLKPDVIEPVRQLATERGVSMSAMLSELVHAALLLPQFQPRPPIEQVKAEAVRTAIKGGDISDLKVKALLELVEHLTKEDKT